MAEIAALGLRDIKIAASSLFPVHAPLVEHIRSGVVTGIATGYMAGPVAEAVVRGWLATPAVMQTHGGRARAIESGDVHIDVAFVAAPTADTYGNLNGVDGKSACGTLGYPMVDVRHADRVVAITDNLVPYPACPIDITQDDVDYVVAVELIGDPRLIASGLPGQQAIQTGCGSPRRRRASSRPLVSSKMASPSRRVQAGSRWRSRRI